MAKNNKGINAPKCVEKVMEQLKASNVISSYTIRGGGYTKLGSKKKPLVKYGRNGQGEQIRLEVHCGIDVGRHSAFVVPGEESLLERYVTGYQP